MKRMPDKIYKYIKQMLALTHIAGGHLGIPSYAHDYIYIMSLLTKCRH